VIKNLDGFNYLVHIKFCLTMINVSLQGVYSRLMLEWDEFRRWNSSVDHSEKFRVFYGIDKVAGPNEKVWGGLVKLQDLVGEFPNHPKNPNLLYLVSSSLPSHATRMSSLAKKNGCNLVLNQNGVAYPAWCSSGWKDFNRTMMEILHESHWVFYQSNFCRLAADVFLGERLHNAEVLYNAVDTSIFVPRKEPKQNKTICLLLAGSHGKAYRVQKAIQALSILRRSGLDCTLTIAGRFAWKKDERAALSEAHEMAAKEGVLNLIDFQGPYLQSQAVHLFHEADILLHTTYNDVCPRLVIEAMACGLPVVYSASGGMPELVGTSAGIGVSAPLDWDKEHPPSPDALAYAVKQVVAECSSYAREARKRAVAKFDVVPWIKRHREVFSCLVFKK